MIIKRIIIITKLFVSILFHQESLKVVDDCVFIEFNLFTYFSLFFSFSERSVLRGETVIFDSLQITWYNS